jgi:signal transduction histidine kinase
VVSSRSGICPVRRWRDYSADDPWRSVGPGLVVAGAVVGVATVVAAFEWDDARRWIPNLTVGLVFIIAGATVCSRRSGTGLLLAATGFAWFAGDFDSGLVYLHRGPLVHLVVSYVGWRPRGRLDAIAIVAGYVAALVVPLWNEPLPSTVLALGLVAEVARSTATSTGRARSERSTALLAAVIFALAVISFAVVNRAVPSGAAVEPMLLAYHAALVTVAALFAVKLASPSSLAVADLVVELGESRSPTLRAALADVLGDPTLEVGYVSPDGSYRDEQGNVLELPCSDDSRAATIVQWEAQPFAVLVHDATVLDEPAVAEAVVAATRLSAAHNALTAEVRRQLDAVDASRRRLVVVADEQRRRLETRLREGAERRIVELAEELTMVSQRHRWTQEAQSSASASDEAIDHVDRAVRHLKHTAADLRLIGSGLHPRDLDAGLAAALQSLVERCPLEVSARIDDGVMADGEIAVAAYYVCAEALANVAKHAEANSATVHLSRRGHALVVEVVDDGAGGAEPTAGSGLRGLADRVEALGGVLTVTSPIGAGTRLVAEMPLGHQRS